MKTLLKVLLVVAVCLAIMEAVGYVMVKKLEGEPVNYCTNDELNLRIECGEQINVSQDDYNIICIGDSFTFGHGLENIDETWPRILQKRIGSDYKVYNFSHIGYNSHAQVAHFSTVYGKLAPDFIIWQFLWNDVQPCVDYPGFLINEHYENSGVLKHSKFFKWMSYLFVYPDIFKQVEESTAGFYNKGTDEWKGLKSSIERMGSITRACGVPVVFVVYQVLNTHDYGYADQVLAIARQQGFTTYMPRYPEDIDFSEYIVSSRNIHPNKRCNEWFVEKLYGEVLSSKF